jgi:hypothetical protein
MARAILLNQFARFDDHRDIDDIAYEFESGAASIS